MLERHRIAERWRSERWDGLKFQFPNWSVRLPDFPFPHADPDGFATIGEIIGFHRGLCRFRRRADPLRRRGDAVAQPRRRIRLRRRNLRWPIEADNVVVATGPYQRPVVPDLLRDEPVFQVHASQYRNPAQLPPGAVLVVGAGASGAQIAEELLRAGRRVYLSVGRHRRMPRRYRGRDLIWWLDEMGLLQRPAEERGPDAVIAADHGAYGGHTIDFRRFAAEGMMLLGRIEAAQHGVIELRAGSGREAWPMAMLAYTIFLDMVDAYVEQHGLDLPEDPGARAALPTRPALPNRCGGSTSAPQVSLR